MFYVYFWELIGTRDWELETRDWELGVLIKINSNEIS